MTSFSYDATANRVTLQWDSTTTAWYQAEMSSDLAEWADLGGPFQVTTAGEAASFQFPEGGDRNYLRVREVPAP